ncbi:MAG: MarR family winged helix-turn-helix transcriptional regulator [Corynebacterium sp.]|nr:MarR family winged helix-turn-helix transcriptional regulator [Corynebacterium sp.]
MEEKTTHTPLEVAEAIRPALTKLYVSYFRVTEQSSLTGPQITILERLHEQGPMRIREIAQAEGIRMPTASNALHVLESRGLVERGRDRSDRRGVSVSITEHGQAELDRVGEERTAFLARMLETMDQENLQEAYKLGAIINTLADSYARELSGQQDAAR